MNPYDTTGAATCICIVVMLPLYLFISSINTFICHIIYIISYRTISCHIKSYHTDVQSTDCLGYKWCINLAAYNARLCTTDPIIQKQHKTTPSARQKYVFLCPWISHGPQKLCSIGLSERHTTMGQHKSRKSITSMWRAISSAICLDLNQQSCSKADKHRQTLSKILPQPAQRVKDLWRSKLFLMMHGL